MTHIFFKKKIKPALIFILFTLTIYQNQCFAQNWELKSDEEGVKVLTRAVPGSEMAEFKGIAEIDAPIEVITELLRDVPAYSSWIYNCSEAEILKKQNSNNFVIYYVYDSPWPVDDRWIVLESRSEVDCKNLKVVIRLFNIEYSNKKETNDMVKMKKMMGDYTLEYLNKNKTRVSYTMFVDPGGSIPASLANVASIDIPKETLKKMKIMVKKDKYIVGAKNSDDKNIVDECLRKKKENIQN